MGTFQGTTAFTTCYFDAWIIVWMFDWVCPRRPSSWLRLIECPLAGTKWIWRWAPCAHCPSKAREAAAYKGNIRIWYRIASRPIWRADSWRRGVRVAPPAWLPTCTARCTRMVHTIRESCIVLPPYRTWSVAADKSIRNGVMCLQRPGTRKGMRLARAGAYGYRAFGHHLHHLLECASSYIVYYIMYLSACIPLWTYCLTITSPSPIVIFFRFIRHQWLYMLYYEVNNELSNGTQMSINVAHDNFIGTNIIYPL